MRYFWVFDNIDLKIKAKNWGKELRNIFFVAMRAKTDPTRKRRTKKREDKMANFCEVGEMKTRGKWQIM